MSEPDIPFKFSLTAETDTSQSRLWLKMRPEPLAQLLDLFNAGKFDISTELLPEGIKGRLIPSAQGKAFGPYQDAAKQHTLSFGRESIPSLDSLGSVKTVAVDESSIEEDGLHFFIKTENIEQSRSFTRKIKKKGKSKPVSSQQTMDLLFGDSEEDISETPFSDARHPTNLSAEESFKSLVEVKKYMKQWESEHNAAYPELQVECEIVIRKKTIKIDIEEF